ncbi:MAG: helix-turn-helix domain-containing protein [Fimbriimonas sp.]
MDYIPPNQAFGPTINRVRDVMAHTTRYAFDGVARLAADSGLHRTTLSRVLYGKINPSARTVARIASTLERAIGRPIDPRDLFAENGGFPTRYTCDLCGCRGCLPDAATDEFGDRKAAFRDVQPGQWVTSQFPNGLRAQKGV